MSEFKINGRKIGPDQPTYIIGEMSANHHHSLQTAREPVSYTHLTLPTTPYV